MRAPAPRESWIETNGVRLHVTLRGDGPATPLVLLHGFTGSAATMEGVAARCGGRVAVSIDLLGHGESDAPDETPPYTMERCVAQVVAVLDALGLERPHLLGYSMGGRVAFSLAARHLDRIASLTLIGASPGLADEATRRERVAADEALAEDLMREGLEVFVDRWMAIPLFASQQRLGRAALEEARRQRLANRPEGLARSLRGLGTGAMPPLHDALACVRRPVLLVVGDEDAKFQGIARAMCDALPDARVVSIPAAGHAAHLESPDAFGRALRAFLTAADAAATQEGACRR